MKKTHLISGSLLAFAVLAASCSESSTQPARQGDSDSASAATAVSEAKTARDFMPPVETDIFNPDMRKEDQENQTPRRGGVLRLRNPANLKGLNAVLASGQPEMVVINHMTDSLVDQCPETLEYFPEIAWYWGEADIIKLKGGEPQEGRIIAEADGEITFVPGAWRYNFGKYEVARHDAETKTLTLRDDVGGTTYSGSITERIYTIEVDEGNGEKVDSAIIISVSDLDEYTRTVGTYSRTTPYVKRNSAFRFFIRDGVTWHDGQPFTSDDVIFTLDTIKNTSVEAQRFRSVYDEVTHYTANAEERSVTMHYAYPYFQALSALGFATGSSVLIPKHTFRPEQYGGDEQAFAQAFNRHPFDESPVYTGPYQFASWDRSNALVLKRNENYWKNKLPAESLIRWKPEQPYFDEIRWVLYTDATAALRDLINERIDADLDVEPTGFASPDTRQAFFTDKIVKAEKLGQLYTYIGWNHERDIFKDPQVRRALAMLVPREEITRSVHLGAAIPVTGPFFVDGPAYDRSIEQIPYDPDGAIALLARAGWLDRNNDGVLDKVIDGRSVSLEFTYHIHNARDYHQKIADIIKERIEQAGIRMTIVRSDWSVFADNVRKKEYDAVRFAWSAPLEPDPFQVWHSSQIADGGDNFIAYRNDRIDEIAITIRETFDPLRRWELAREMHRIVAEEQPVCFLYGMKEQYFISRKIRGVRLYPTIYTHDFTEWWRAE